LSTLDPSAIAVTPKLAPDLDELRKELAIRRGSGSAVPEESKESTEANQSVQPSQPTSTGPGTTDDTLDIETLYMAIVASDSTVVYYKLTKGIKKPADVPDE
jgi:hypothetical protein